MQNILLTSWVFQQQGLRHGLLVGGRSVLRPSLYMSPLKPRVPPIPVFFIGFRPLVSRHNPKTMTILKLKKEKW